MVLGASLVAAHHCNRSLVWYSRICLFGKEEEGRGQEILMGLLHEYLYSFISTNSFHNDPNSTLKLLVLKTADLRGSRSLGLTWLRSRIERAAEARVRAHFWGEPDCTAR